MNHEPENTNGFISDDELVLVFYGEHDNPELANVIANTPQLSERFARLSETLSGLETFEAPQRPADYGAATWRRIESKLLADSAADAPSWWSKIFSPQFSVAGVALLVGATLLAFWAGQHSRDLQEPGLVHGPTAGQSGPLQLDPQRLLNTRVAEHLAATDMLLTQRVNRVTGADSGITEAEWATDLLLSNRLYRRAADRAGHARLAALLNEVEPLLLELAHQQQQRAVTDPEAQGDRNLLFKVRVMNQKLDAQSKQI